MAQTKVNIDPDQVLAQILEVADRTNMGWTTGDDGTLARLFLQLHAWITQGGRYPKDWEQARLAAMQQPSADEMAGWGYN